MYIGTILAGLILSGIMESPWPIILTLIAIPIAWYWRKYGNPFRKIVKWQQGRSSSTTNGSSPKKPLARWIKRLLWVFLGIPLVAMALLFVYREWSAVERGLWDIKGFADKATTVSFTIDSLETRSWPNLLPSGRYKVGIRGGEYRFKCLNELNNPGERPAYADGKIPVVSSVGTGRLLVWSTTSANNPQGDGGEFIVGTGDAIFVKPDVFCPGKVFQTTNASIQLSPIK